MLEVSQIREHRDDFVAALAKRGLDAGDDLDRILALDETRRSTQTELDSVLAQSNAISKEIGMLFKAGKTEEANAAKAKTTDLKAQSTSLSESLKSAQEQLDEALYGIPNIPHELVVAGNSEADNQEVYVHGEKPELGDAAMPHWELASKYNLIDFELGNKITGAGFPVYTGKGARLQRALINYFLDYNTDAGYEEVQVPHLVNEASARGTGQLPDKEGQMYHVTEDNLYLIPTAEVPVTNIFRGEMIDTTQLPVLRTGYTPCFRREAGSYGAHVRGLNRLHQFDKVEIVRIESPENSMAALDGMVEHVKGLLEALELPYRILRLCGGDTGFTSAITYDFEVWSAAQGRWLEVSSVSNFMTYQANRLKLRLRTPDNKKMLAHTLNGSALALPRIIACLLENNQHAMGIRVPRVLHDYCKFSEIK